MTRDYKLGGNKRKVEKTRKIKKKPIMSESVELGVEVEPPFPIPASEVEQVSDTVRTDVVDESLPPRMQLEPIKEYVMNISAGTPPKECASSILKIFEENKDNCFITFKAMGAGATHQALKTLMEADAKLYLRGKKTFRYDFWSNEMVANEERSINHIRFCLINIMPNSLVSTIMGWDTTFMRIEFQQADKEGKSHAN